MSYRDVYRGQVQLLIKLLPIVAQEEVFAQIGGTAINLFARNMPRLSVDIDPTYLPLGSYEDAVRSIDAALQRVADQVKAGVPRTIVVMRVRGNVWGHRDRGARGQLMTLCGPWELLLPGIWCPEPG